MRNSTTACPALTEIALLKSTAGDGYWTGGERGVGRGGGRGVLDRVLERSVGEGGRRRVWERGIGDGVGEGCGRGVW